MIARASALSRAVVGVTAHGSCGEARGWSVHAGIVFAVRRASASAESFATPASHTVVSEFLSVVTDSRGCSPRVHPKTPAQAVENILALPGVRLIPIPPDVTCAPAMPPPPESCAACLLPAFGQLERPSRKVLVTCHLEKPMVCFRADRIREDSGTNQRIIRGI